MHIEVNAKNDTALLKGGASYEPRKIPISLSGRVRMELDYCVRSSGTWSTKVKHPGPHSSQAALDHD